MSSPSDARIARLLARARQSVYGAPDAALADAESVLAGPHSEAERAHALLIRARVHARTARPGSLADAERALAWFESEGQAAGIAECLVAVANAHVLAGRYADAYEPLARARRYAVALGDGTLLASVLNLLAIARSDLGDLVEAERILREAIGLTLAVGATGLRMILQSNLAQNHVRWCVSGAPPSNATARLIEAAAMLSDVEAFYRAAGDTLGLGAALDNRAQLLLLMGDTSRALTLCAEAAALAQAQGDPTTIIYCALTRARVHAALGEWRAVLEAADGALSLAELHDLSGGVDALRQLRADARLARPGDE